MAGRNNVALRTSRILKIEWFIIGFLNYVLFPSGVDTLVWNILESVYQHFEKQAVSPYYYKL
jgi:hypothetical protein